MRVVCKVDYGQFEYNKTYDYSYSFQNNFKKYYVVGEYGTNEFTKRQFDAIFEVLIVNKNKNKSYNY